MSASTSATGSYPSNNFSPNVGSSSVGPAVYYGAIAVALFLICIVTITSRVFYRRKQRRLMEARLREERIALERRGEAPGLPTYGESRGTAPGLPNYTLTYQAPNSPPPSTPGAPAPGGNPAPAPSPASEHHFHFHFPSLPAALHLRPTRTDDPESFSNAAPLAHAPPSYEHEPPKYESDITDQADSSGGAGPNMREVGTTSNAERSQFSLGELSPGHELAETRLQMPEPIPEIDEENQTEYVDTEDFVHPEERRRNEEQRRREAGDIV